MWADFRGLGEAQGPVQGSSASPGTSVDQANQRAIFLPEVTPGSGLMPWPPPPWFYGLYSLAVPVAAGLSYSRNKSVGWAALHGLVAVPYLVYFFATGGLKGGGKPNPSRGRTRKLVQTGPPARRNPGKSGNRNLPGSVIDYGQKLDQQGCDDVKIRDLGAGRYEFKGWGPDDEAFVEIKTFGRGKGRSGKTNPRHRARSKASGRYVHRHAKRSKKTGRFLKKSEPRKGKR